MKKSSKAIEGPILLTIIVMLYVTSYIGLRLFGQFELCGFAHTQKRWTGERGQIIESQTESLNIFYRPLIEIDELRLGLNITH